MPILIKYFGAALLVVDMTGLFTAIAAQLNLPYRFVSVSLLLSHALYLFLSRRTLIGLLGKKKYYWFWVIMVFMWPAVTYLYAYKLGLNLRQVGLQLFYILMLLSASTYVLQFGWNAMRKLAGISLLIGIAGLFASLAIPGFVTSVANIKLEAGRSYIEGGGRAFGLFLNPNQTARNLLLVFILWMIHPYKRWQFYTPLIWSVLLFGSLIATGSRGTIGLAVIVLTIFLQQAFARPPQVRHSANPVQIIALSMLALVVPLLLAGVLREVGSRLIEDVDRRSSLSSRLYYMSQLDDSTLANLEDAIRNRIDVTAPYYDESLSRPIIGHGIAGMSTWRYLANLPLQSHNSFVSLAFNYGYPYLFAMGLLFFFLFFQPFRKIAEDHFGVSFVLLFVLCLGGIAMVQGTIFNNRPVYVVVGAILALVSHPPVAWSQNSLPLSKRPHPNGSRPLYR